MLVGGLFVVLLGASGWFHHLLRRGAQDELARLQVPYEQAQALAARHAELQRRLGAAATEAELMTYLRHPWPSTQILSAALAPLPDCITLQQIRLFRVPPGPTQGIVQPNQNKPDDPGAPKLTPAEHDLLQLREECDHGPLVLMLTGLTSDTASLQRYLVILGDVKLFVKADLSSMEANSADRPGALRFTARLVVRPGYGQPDGPAPGGPSFPGSAWERAPREAVPPGFRAAAELQARKAEPCETCVPRRSMGTR